MLAKTVYMLKPLEAKMKKTFGVGEGTHNTTYRLNWLGGRLSENSRKIKKNQVNPLSCDNYSLHGLSVLMNCVGFVY